MGKAATGEGGEGAGGAGRAPWPSFRGNPRNTGVSEAIPLGPAGAGAAGGGAPPAPWRFPTGNGVFSTPVIGPGETIYVGSADGCFYALDPVARRERWRFQTGECIDSAGCIGRDGTVYVASCDARVYALDPESGRERWRFDVLRERPRFTPSTIFWFEGNIVEGPGGLLYAGGDDFYLYALEPSGRLRFAVPAGLHIWTAPAFADGAAIFAAFDLFAYAIDAETGRERWRSNLRTFAASSPAIAPDGLIWIGGFDGALVALAPRDGRVVARVATGGAIYATPAIAPDGTLYVGSADGLFYAIATGPESRRGEVLWTFATGDPIRASAAVGPDPEGRAPYLVYVGGGNGLIYAFEPGGRRRWSWDTVAGAGEGAADFPNLNASIALGARGLATASAGGDVFYVPYAPYRCDPPPAGVSRQEDDGYPREGAFWYPLGVGGRPAAAPLPPEAGPGRGRAAFHPAEGAGRAAFHPAETVSLRAVVRCGGRTLRAAIDPASLRVSREPAAPLRTWVQADRTAVHIVPEALSRAGEEFTLRARATLRTPAGPIEIAGALPALVTPAAQAPPLARLLDMPFRIARMAVHAPSIVPSFDQIGIASLRIEVRVVHAGGRSGRGVAFGLLKFGRSESGEQAGVPLPRHLLYAFAARYEEGHLALEAGPCRFEITSFPVPLDRLRFAGSLDADGAPSLGASLFAEVALPALTPRGALALVAAGLRRAPLALAQLRAGSPGGRLLPAIPEAARFLARVLPLAREVLSGRLVRPLGLLDEERRFTGAGTFRPRPLPASATAPPPGFRLARLEAQGGARLTAEVALAPDASPRPAAVLAILLVDLEAEAPVPLDYDGASTLERDARGNPIRATLSLPRPPPGAALRRVRALAMIDLAILGEADFELRLGTPRDRCETGSGEH